MRPTACQAAVATNQPNQAGTRPQKRTTPFAGAAASLETNETNNGQDKIRTCVACATILQTAPFNHSGTCPDFMNAAKKAGRFLSSRRQDLNPRPAVYKTAALPLSYIGANLFWRVRMRKRSRTTKRSIRRETATVKAKNARFINPIFPASVLYGWRARTCRQDQRA